MSFEKKMKKRGNQKLDAFAKNPYHQEPIMETKPARRGMPLWSKILIPVGAVAMGIFGSFIGMRMVFGGFGNKATNDGGYYSHQEEGEAPAAISEDKGGRDDSRAPYTPSSPEGATASWEELTITSKFPTVNYSDLSYIEYSGDKAAPINAQYIASKMDENITVNGYDYNLNKDHTTEVTIYSIKNIHYKAALAVQFEGTSDYYAYVCLSYISSSYDELYDELGFANELSLDSVAYTDEEGHSTNQPINNQNDLKALLASYKGQNLNNIYPNDPDVPQEGKIDSIMVSISIPCLDIKIANIEFYNYGLLSIRFSHALPHQFDLGVASYNAFKEVAMLAIK